MPSCRPWGWSTTTSSSVFAGKSLNDGSTHPFSSLSSDQTHDDKIFCMQDLRIQFPTFLSLQKLKKREEDSEFPALFFRQVASFAIFEHKMAITSSRVYCCSTTAAIF